MLRIYYLLDCSVELSQVEEVASVAISENKGVCTVVYNKVCDCLLCQVGDISAAPGTGEVSKFTLSNTTECVIYEH